MRTLTFIRAFFLIISGIFGYYVGTLIGRPILGFQIGCLSGLVLIFVEQKMQRVSVRGLSSVVFGLLLGVFLAKLISDMIALMRLGDFYLANIRVVLTIVFSYLGAVMALRGRDEFNIIIPYVKLRRQDMGENIILLDTSAIIDGRILDIYKTYFLMGRLLVPRFVLLELQALSDSADDIKRERGRRGMELLKNMQENPKIDIEIHEDESADDQSVDSRLVNLARQLDARLCTVDFNLGRIAALQKVGVLNIHELVNAVKRIVFMGEELDVSLMKEGKEPDQAVAYLEDGTMIVVSEAKKLIGQKVKTIVTSVLETQAGKMIFAKLKE